MRVKMVSICNKPVNIVYEEITLNIIIIALYSISDNALYIYV